MENLIFAPMQAKHLDSLAPIAATAPDPWSRADLAAELDNPFFKGWVVSAGKTMAGFASFRLEDEAAELGMMAVVPAFRGQGVGAALLGYCLAQTRRLGAARCILEVRTGNAAALALYQRQGFTVLARRPGLYANPTEDGYTMEIQF